MPAAGPVVGLLQASAVDADVDRARHACAVFQGNAEGQVSHHGQGVGVLGPLGTPEGEVEVAREIPLRSDDLPLVVAVAPVPVEHHPSAVVRRLRGVLGRPVEGVAGGPAEGAGAVVQTPLGQVRNIIDDRASGAARARRGLRLVIVDHEVPGFRAVAVFVGDDDAGIRYVHTDRVKALVLPPEKVARRDVAVDVIFDERQEVAQHDFMDRVLGRDVTGAGEDRAAGVVEVAMACALHDRGLPIFGGPLVKVEGLAEVAARRAVHIGVARGGPEVVVDFVGIRAGGFQEVRGEHAAQKDDIIEGVVTGVVALIAYPVIGPGYALAPAAVTDPGDAVCVDVPVERAPADGGLVFDDVGRVRERCGGGGLDAGACVVGVAHHDVSVRGHVIADVVVPCVIVAVAVADDDQRK